MRRRAIIGALLVLAALWGSGVAQAPAQAAAGNRAGLVVQMGDGDVLTRCVSFSGDSISGYDLLMESGLDVEAVHSAGLGAAICSIEGQGCPTSKCLTCAGDKYWSYWHWQNGSWVYSQVGASGYKAHDGDIEGWAWGTGKPPSAPDMAQICPSAETPTPTATPPQPPTLTPTPTAWPTATPEPSATPGPPPTVSLRAEHEQVAPGECTWIYWEAQGADAVYLDDVPVEARSQAQVCPQLGQVYTVRAVNSGGEAVATVSVAISSATPVAQVAGVVATLGDAAVEETMAPANTAETAAPGVAVAAEAGVAQIDATADAEAVAAEAVATNAAVDGEAVAESTSANTPPAAEMVMPALNVGGRTMAAIVAVVVVGVVGLHAWRRRRQ